MFQAPLRLLHDGLLHSLARVADKSLAVVEGEPHSYAALGQQSGQLAQALLERGLQRGDRVAIYMDNTWPCIVSIFATLRAGGAFMVINPQTKHDKLVFMLEDSGAHILLSDTHLHPVLNPVIEQPPAQLHHMIVSGEHALTSQVDAQLQLEAFAEVLASAGPFTERTTIIASDLAALIYTSGSTGNPKGVMHTHLSMVFALNSIIQYLRLSEDDRILNVLPMAFDYGLYQLLMSVWLGATLVLERSFTYPAQVLKRIEEYQVTVFPGVPTIYSMLIAQYGRKPFALESIRRVTNTAAALPKSMLIPLRAIFPNALIFKMYGLTECKRTCYLEPELLDTHGDSVGKAIPGTEVFLLSPEGERMPPGSEGILHVRGPHLMLGYWKRPDQTAQMLKAGELPNERILCTHDWFRMDQDGFLYFVGRTDDIIKSRGEKVSPLEVEKVLLTIDGVDEAAVIGVDDDVLGQAVKAFVTLHAGCQLKEHELKKICMSRLENFMVPKFIDIIETMPKSPNGKIDKKWLKSPGI